MALIRYLFNKSAAQYDQAAILQQEIAKRLMQRFHYLIKKTAFIIDLGAGTGLLTEHLHKLNLTKVISIDIADRALLINRQKHPDIVAICADACQLPLKNQCADLVISNLMLQWCFDMTAVFKEVKRILKPGGLFLFSTFGPDTLLELKKSWLVVDDKTHVNQFIDMHDIGDLLQKELQNPVTESERIILTYAKVEDLILDLRKIGANYLKNRNHRSLSGKHKFLAMKKQYEHYRQNNKLPATYEVIYGHAWQKDKPLDTITLKNI